MSHAFEFEVTAPFAVGNLVADVALEDGATAQVGLRDGPFSGALDARPVSSGRVALFELLQLRGAPNSDRRFLGFVALAPCGIEMTVRPQP